jgi:hypothetical protein
LRKFGYENGRKGIWKLLNIEDKTPLGAGRDGLGCMRGRKRE